MSEASFMRQLVPTMAACLGAFGLGNALAWTSPSLPSIDETLCVDPITGEDDCDIPDVSQSQASWMSSVLALAAIVAGPVTGFLLGAIGRKWTMIIYALPLALGNVLFLIAYFLEDDISIYLGRILTGFAGGAFALTVPVYVVEIASPELRGALASMMQLTLTVGIMYVDALYINEAVEWYIISGTLIVPPVLLALAMFFMPESPVYLVAKGRDDEALKSLIRLRGPGYDSKSELENLREENRKQAGTVSLSEFFSDGIYWKPCLVVVALMFFQQFAGVNAVLFYTSTIFIQAGSEMDEGLSAFLVALAQVLATFVAVVIVERFGRKLLLIVSAIFMSLSLFALGTYFYMIDEDHIQDFDADTIDALGWLPLVSLILFICSFSIGFGPLPWALNAEINPPESKSISSAVGYSFNWLCAFLVTFFERDMEEAMGIFGVYFMYATFCAIAVVYVLLVVPETKGKTPDDLRRLFNKNAVIENKRESVSSYGSVEDGKLRDLKKRESVSSRSSTAS